MQEQHLFPGSLSIIIIITDSYHLFPSDLHVLRGPPAVHRPREQPHGSPERAPHGRREATGRAPGLQTPQVVSPT